MVDSTVWELYKVSLLQAFDPSRVICLPISEERKTLATVQELYDALLERQVRRSTALTCIGGGILQDIAGFAASTLFRGLAWTFVPTTLLAQADSCIGSKTSLNYKGFKNLLGTFYPPREVYIFPPFLGTLAEADYYSGLGEVIKLYIMGGESRAMELAGRLPALRQRDPSTLLEAVQAALAVKLSYISGDEFDQGRRNLLNYGHDFGHALEAASNFAIPHGQAVVAGMLLANAVARRRGRLSPELERTLANSLLLPGLVVRPRPADLDPGPVIAAMRKDKKRRGAGLALIILTADCQLDRIDDLEEEEVAAVLAETGRPLASQDPAGHGWPNEPGSPGSILTLRNCAWRFYGSIRR